MNKQSLITVIGSNGGIGGAIVDELLRKGYTNVRGVTISGKEKYSRAIKVIRADARIKPELLMACEDSEVIFGAFNASEYSDKEWGDEFPVMMDSFITCGKNNGAKLIFMDNLYSYKDLMGIGVYDENTPEEPVNTKGEIRMRVAKQFLDGLKVNGLKGNIIKSSDLYGPYALNSMIGDRFFEALFKKGVGEVLPFGNNMHSFSYTRDVARLAVEVIENDILIPVLHTPNTSPIGMEDLVTKTFGYVDGGSKLASMPKFVMNVLSFFVKPIKSLIAMQYLWNNRYEVVSLYNADFVPTNIDTGVKETVEWFRNNI